MFAFTTNYTTLMQYPKINQALTLINHKLNLYKNRRGFESHLKYPDSLVIGTYQYFNINLSEEECDVLTAILKEPFNTQQIRDVFIEIAQTLKIKDPEVELDPLVIKTQDTIRIDFNLEIFSSQEINPSQHLNNYFENQLYIQNKFKNKHSKYKQSRIKTLQNKIRSKSKSQEIIPILLTLKDYQTKLAMDFNTQYFADTWPTINKNPLKP